MAAKNPQRRQRILELRLAGKSLSEIATELGIKRDLVGQYLRGILRRGEIAVCSKEHTRRKQAEGMKKRTETIDAKLSPAIKMRKEGMTLEEIGKELGRHPNTISLYLKKFGLPNKSDKSASLHEKLIALRNEGLTYREIADRTGKTHGTVGVILSRLVKKGLLPHARFKKGSNET